MTRIITLTVPEASPSLNTINGRHWRHYRDQKKTWEKLIWVAKAEAGIYGMPMFLRSHITIARYGVKSLDADNLVGGCKMVIDSLKALGIIADDSPRHIELVVTQKISKDIRTVIDIKEVVGAVC